MSILMIPQWAITFVNQHKLYETGLKIYTK